ncbi:helix-turn-helix domain-containing protein [Candidatus Omnitrophota bacterium]
MEHTKYLSVAQVAKIIGISRIAVYKKVKSGKIKAVRIGRIFAIPEEAIKKYLSNGKGAPLKDEEKQEIEKAVKKTIDEYGEVLRRLGNE